MLRFVLVNISGGGLGFKFVLLRVGTVSFVVYSPSLHGTGVRLKSMTIELGFVVHSYLNCLKVLTYHLKGRLRVQTV